MKKTFSIITVFLILLCTLSSCADNRSFSGEVTARGSMPEMFVLESSGEKNGFIINENTEFIFDSKTLEEINYYEGEKLSDYFGCHMEAEVRAGEKTSPAQNCIPSDVKGWYFAKTVTVTNIKDEYFAVDY